jgi:hypothetical protein
LFIYLLNVVYKLEKRTFSSPFSDQDSKFLIEL